MAVKSEAIGDGKLFVSVALNRFANRGLHTTLLKNLKLLLYRFREMEVFRHIQLVVCFMVVSENERQVGMLVYATLQAVHTWNFTNVNSDCVSSYSFLCHLIILYLAQGRDSSLCVVTRL
jgi:hypothetical protein